MLDWVKHAIESLGAGVMAWVVAHSSLGDLATLSVIFYSTTMATIAILTYRRSRK